MRNFEAQDREDARDLARFGYRQELARRLGWFSSFAIGFSVISVLTGVISTFGDALRAGGAVGLGLGWPLVSAGTLLVALALAELASAFPTAGALYHWSALLGGALPAWTTAILNLLGQTALAAAIDLACAQAFAQSFGLPALAYPLFIVLLLMHGAINALSVRLVAWLNDASATVHVVGIAVLAGLLLSRGRVHGVAHLAASPAEGLTTRRFLLSLVLGVWTFTGFDAAAHLSEETHQPRERSPFGIVSSVAVSALAGYVLIAALVLATRPTCSAPDLPDAALCVFRAALGSRVASLAMGLVAVAMWFAGLSSVTSASRMLFAFARDDGIPWAPALRVVNLRTKTPVRATVVCVVAGLSLVSIAAFLGESVFLAVAAIATIALYASYGLPILLGAVARMQGRWTRLGPFSLKGAGVAVAWVAVAWTLFVFVVCALANASAMYAFVALLAALALTWLSAVRRNFVGPKIDLAHFEHAVPKR